MISWSQIVNVLAFGMVTLGLGVGSPLQAASEVRLEDGFSLPALLEVHTMPPCSPQKAFRSAAELM